MRVLSVEASREIDRVATAEYGLPSLVLMENAALGVVDALCEVFPRSERVGIFCGPGNNGGDGLAVARHLDLRGYRVDVLLVGDRETTGDAALQESVCRRQGVEMARLLSLEDLPARGGGLGRDRRRPLRGRVVAPALGRLRGGRGLDHRGTGRPVSPSICPAACSATRRDFRFSCARGVDRDFRDAQAGARAASRLRRGRSARRGRSGDPPAIAEGWRAICGW